MTDEGSDWTKRIDRLMAGTTVEQVRHLVDEVKEGLDKISAGFSEHAQSVSGATRGMDEAVVDVKGQVEGLRSQVETLARQIDSVQALRDDLVRALEAVRGVERPSELLEPLAERIMAIEQTLHAVAKNTTELAGSTGAIPSDLAARIDAVSGEIEARSRDLLDAIGRRLAVVETTVREDAGTSREALSEAVERTERSLTSVLDALQDVAQRIGGIDHRLADASTATQVRAIEERLAEISTTLRGSVEQVLDERTGGITEEVRTQAERLLGAIAQRVGAIQTALVQDADANREATGRTETSLLAVAEAVQALVQRVSAFEPKLDAASGAEELRAIDAEIRTLDARLGEVTASIRSDFELIARGEREEQQRALDALGLRMTNMAVELTQALDAVREQVAGVAARAAAMEAENAAVLRNVGDQIAGVGDALVNRVAERATSFGEQTIRRVDELAASIGAIDEAVRAAGASMQPVHDAIASLGADLRGTGGAVGEARDVLGRIEERLGALHEHRETLGRVEERLGALSEHRETLGRMEERLGALHEHRETLGRIEGRLGALGDRTDEALPRMEEQLHTLRERTEALTTLRAEVGALKEPLATLAVVEEQVRALGGMPGALGELARTDDLLRIATVLSTAPSAEDVQRIEFRVAGLAEHLDAILERTAAIGHIAERADQLRAALQVAASEEAVEGVRERLGSLDEVVRAAATGMTEARATVDEALGGVRSELAATGAQLAARVDAVEAAMARVMVEAREALSAVRGDARAGVAEAAEQLVTTVTSLREHMDGLRADLLDRVQAAAAAVPAVEQVAEATGERIAPSLERLERASESRADALSADVSKVDSSVNEIWLRVKALAQASDELRAAVEMSIQEAAQRAAAADERLAAIDATQRQLRQDGEELARALRETITSIDASAAGARDGFVAAAEGLREAIAGTFDDTKRDLTGTVETARAEFETGVRGTLSELGGSVQAAKDAVEQAAVTVRASVEAATEDANKAVAAAIAAVREEVKATLSGTREALDQAVARAQGDVAASVESAREQIVSSADAARTDVASAVTGIREELLGAVAAAQGQVRELLDRSQAAMEALVEQTERRLDALFASGDERLVSAVREVEVHRDAHFYGVLNELADKLTRADKAGLGEKLRTLVGARRRPDQPQGAPSSVHTEFEPIPLEIPAEEEAALVDEVSEEQIEPVAVLEEDKPARAATPKKSAAKKTAKTTSKTSSAKKSTARKLAHKKPE